MRFILSLLYPNPNTHMADTSVVSRVTSNVWQEPTPSASETQSSERFRMKKLPPDTGKFSKINSLGYLREILNAEGMSKRATSLKTNS